MHMRRCRSVTTVDVWIHEVDGPFRTSIGNGLFGPATNLMHAIGDRVLAGELAGTFEGGTALETECSGAYLIQLLESYDDKQLFDLGGEAVPTSRVRAQLKATSTYAVGAIEF
jgi:hypothetical protein